MIIVLTVSSNTKRSWSYGCFYDMSRSEDDIELKDVYPKEGKPSLGLVTDGGDKTYLT
jgi:hypothetical protein